MGRIRNKKVKNIAEKLLMEFPNLFTDNFYENKKILEKVAVFYSKRLRNQVAGYIAHLIRKQKELLGGKKEE